MATGTAVARMTRIAAFARLPPQIRADLKELLAIIAEQCEDHESCEQCGAQLCVTCGLGDAADGADDCATVHCSGCWGSCGPCQDEVARDTADEQRNDRWADLR